MCAKAFGADAVAITDIKPDNLELARQLGADVAMHLDSATDPAQVPAGLAADPAQAHPCSKLCLISVSKGAPEPTCYKAGVPARRLLIACAPRCPAVQTSSLTALALSRRCR